MRQLHVTVPASSANLGPGFDTFAIALGLRLELTVTETGRFAVETDLDIPRDRGNLIVRAFERLHPADGIEFRIASAIPQSGGLGSSAAAIVAGVMAADALYGLGSDLLGVAAAIEGHPDNVAAALLGGFVVCAGPGARRFDLPTALDAVLVVPDEHVRTKAARAALPNQVPICDATFNVAHGALLALGITSGDRQLLTAGLRDRLHQPYRASLYPRSAELMADARKLGALGGTISGAGPTVLLWCEATDSERLIAALEPRVADWAQTIHARFESAGASITNACVA